LKKDFLSSTNPTTVQKATHRVMSLTHFLLFYIGWKTNRRRFIPQTKNPTNVGLDIPNLV